MLNNKFTCGCLTALFGFFSIFIGAVYLGYYLHIIGRPDLILNSLSSGVNVFYAFFLVAVLGALAIVLHLMPSLFLIALNKLLEITGVKNVRALGVSAGMCAFATVSFFLALVVVYSFGFNEKYVSWLLMVIFFLICFFCVIVFRFFCSGFLKVIFISLIFSLLVLLSALFANLLIISLIKYGARADDTFLDVFFFFLVFVVAVATFLPGVIVSSDSLGDNRSKLQVCMLVSIGVVASFLFVAPDIRKVAVFNAGKIIGLHNNNIWNYALNADDEIFKVNKIWPEGNVGSDGVFQGKKIFGIFDIELVCPASKNISASEILSTKQKIGIDCIVLRSNQVTKGSMVSEGNESS